MIKLYKKRGETPLEALKRLRRQRPELSSERLSYAGRLDPMASGILPVLVGEENDRRESYLSTDKTYIFSVLFGVSTDTFDILGLVQDVDERLYSDTSDEWFTSADLKETANVFTGEWEMAYPPYSSKTVELDGKQVSLWKIARAGRLQEVSIPTKTVYIHNLQVRKTKRRPKTSVTSYVRNQIEKVNGDFRQDEIIANWERGLEDVSEDTRLPTATFKIYCSSGTYVRRLADEIGKQLGVPATALVITRVGTGA
jgi:tRNA pseudouridine55 synthase